MLRQILMILGISTIVVGYSSTASAQTSVPYRSNSSVTLSGDSLRTVESRRVIDDYQNFFNGTLPTSETNSVTNIGRLTTSPQQFLFGDQPVEVVGDPVSSERLLNSSSANSDAVDRERVRVQWQLGNQ